MSRGLLKADGSFSSLPELSLKTWDLIPVADQRILARKAAKMNREVKAVHAERLAVQRASQLSPEERKARRCEKEGLRQGLQDSVSHRVATTSYESCLTLSPVILYASYDPFYSMLYSLSDVNNT